MPTRLRWDKQKTTRLKELIKAGKSYRVASEVLTNEWGFRVSYNQVEAKCRRIGVHSTATVLSAVTEKIEPYKNKWHFDGDWVVAGDFHIPYVDPKMVSMVVDAGKRYGIKRMIMGGDIFDFQQLGVYKAVVPPPHPKVESNIAEALMDEIMSWYTEVRCILGNHEARILRTLDGTELDDDVMALLSAKLRGGSAVHWTVYGYCTVESPTGTWRFTHPKNYRKAPLSLSIELASRLRQHVCVFHLHRTTMGWHPDGRVVVAEIGCMCDPGKLAYRQLVDTAYPEMTQSFGVLKDGVFYLHSPHAAWGCGKL